MSASDEAVTLKAFLTARLEEQAKAVTVALAAHAKLAEAEYQMLGHRIDEQKDAVAIASVVQQQALAAALQAVADTAAIHSGAHEREHLSHERIHEVEAKQVDEARATITQRLGTLNELRSEVTADRNLLVSREVLDAKLSAMESQGEAGIATLSARINENEKGRQAQAEELASLRGRSAAYSAGLAAVFTLMFIALAFYTAVHKP